MERLTGMLCLNNTILSLSRFFVLFVLSLATVSCGNGGSANNPAPKPRPISSVSGVAFDAQIAQGDVTITNFDTNEVLKTGKTDDAGNYSLTLQTKDQPIEICIQNGQYQEEASGTQVPLTNTEYLCAVQNYTSGQPININVTYYTYLATGLAKYLVSTGVSSDKAIKDANDRISNLIGIDITNTTPLNITDIANASTTASKGLLYGAATASLSQFTQYVSQQNNSQTQQIFTSIYFAGVAYDDIVHDGILDGVGETGSPLSLGKVAITTETYRHILSDNMFGIIGNSHNVSGMTASSIANMATTLNNSTDAIFNNVPVVPMSNTQPTISNISVKDNSVVSGSITLSADVTDIHGLSTVQFLLNDTELATFGPGDTFQYTLDTTSYTDAAYTFKIVATNDFNGVATQTINLTFSNQKTSISNVLPADNSFVSGNFTYSATASDPLGLLSTTLTIDNTDVKTPSDINNISLPIKSTNYSDGTHTFVLKTENTVHYTDSITTHYTIDNTPPTVAFTTLKDGSALTGSSAIIEVDANDNYGLKAVNLYLNGNLIKTFSTFDATTLSFTFDTTSLPDEYVPLIAEAVDSAGNTVQTKINVYVDNTPPSLSAVNVASGDYIQGTLQLTSTSTDTNGVASVTYSINNTVIASGTLDTTTLKDGSYTITVVATDVAGLTTTDTFNIFVDNTPPSVTINSPTDGSYVKGSVTLDYTATDIVSVKDITITFDNLLMTGNVLDSTTQADGKHTLTITATDKAGHSTSASSIITIDNTTPTFTLDCSGVSFVNNTCYLSQVGTTIGTISNVVENNLDTVTVILNHDISTSQQLTAVTNNSVTTYPFVYSQTLPDATYTYTFTITDKAGNSTSQDLNVVIDTKPPTTTIANPGCNLRSSGLPSPDNYYLYVVKQLITVEPLKDILIDVCPAGNSFCGLATDPLSVPTASRTLSAATTNTDIINYIDFDRAADGLTNYNVTYSVFLVDLAGNRTAINVPFVITETAPTCTLQ